MKANRNSLHAKLFRFTYTDFLPSNLCPYFWKLILALFLLIPNLILQLPTLIGELFMLLFGKKTYNDCSDRRTYGLVFYVCLFVLTIYCFTTYHWFKAMFNSYSYSFNGANIGWIINVCILFIILRYFYFKIKPVKHNCEKQHNIMKEFIKAKYYKYCPKIDWK